MYAETTKVEVEKTQAEIKAFVINKRGATGYGEDWVRLEDGREASTVRWRMEGRFITFRLILPDPNDPEFKRQKNGFRRVSDSQVAARFEQAKRSRWRGLLLNIKAKFEAVDSGLETFEQAFLPHILLPDGMTVGEVMIPQVAQAYDSGKMPDLLALRSG